jgi:Domain of unknown function (DUF6894)
MKAAADATSLSRHEGIAPDDEGMEPCTLEAIQEEAARSLADMAPDAILRNSPNSAERRMSIEVGDDAGPVMQGKLYARSSSAWALRAGRTPPSSISANAAPPPPAPSNPTAVCFSLGTQRLNRLGTDVSIGRWAEGLQRVFRSCSNIGAEFRSHLS